jgi:hypothetical protein
MPEGSEESTTALRFMGLRSIQRHGRLPYGRSQFSPFLPSKAEAQSIPPEMGCGWSRFIPALAGVHFTCLPF